MAEDAFERFRRLRSVAPPVSKRDVIPCSNGPQRDKAPQGVVTALTLFATLRESGVVLIPWMDHIRLAAPPGVPCPVLLRALLDLVECYEERAAIAQHGAGLSLAAAEALAWAWLTTQEVQEVSCGRCPDALAPGPAA